MKCPSTQVDLHQKNDNVLFYRFYTTILIYLNKIAVDHRTNANPRVMYY